MAKVLIEKTRLSSFIMFLGQMVQRPNYAPPHQHNPQIPPHIPHPPIPPAVVIVIIVIISWQSLDARPPMRLPVVLVVHPHHILTEYRHRRPSRRHSTTMAKTIRSLPHCQFIRKILNRVLAISFNLMSRPSLHRQRGLPRKRAMRSNPLFHPLSPHSSIACPLSFSSKSKSFSWSKTLMALIIPSCWSRRWCNTRACMQKHSNNRTVVLAINPRTPSLPIHQTPPNIPFVIRA